MLLYLVLTAVLLTYGFLAVAMTLNQKSDAKYILKFLDEKGNSLFETDKSARKVNKTTWEINRQMWVVF